jgi:hypothetical protein
MKSFRNILAMPLVGAFYASIALTGFIAWLANIIAGYDGLISFNAENETTGDSFIRVDME